MPGYADDASGPGVTAGISPLPASYHP